MVGKHHKRERWSKTLTILLVWSSSSHLTFSSAEANKWSAELCSAEAIRIEFTKQTCRGDQGKCQKRAYSSRRKNIDRPAYARLGMSGEDDEGREWGYNRVPWDVLILFWSILSIIMLKLYSSITLNLNIWRANTNQNKRNSIKTVSDIVCFLWLQSTLLSIQRHSRIYNLPSTFSHTSSFSNSPLTTQLQYGWAQLLLSSFTLTHHITPDSWLARESTVYW